MYDRVSCYAKFLPVGKHYIMVICTASILSYDGSTEGVQACMDAQLSKTDIHVRCVVRILLQTVQTYKDTMCKDH